MFTQAQVEYIQRQFSRGVSEADIRKKLSGAGWESDDINDGIKEVARLVALNAPPVPPSQPATPNAVMPGEVAMPALATPPAAHGSKLVLILVIVGIVLVLAAGGFVYMKFIRVPAGSESILLPQPPVATTTEATLEQPVVSETPVESAPVASPEVVPQEPVSAPVVPTPTPTPAPVIVATPTAPVIVATATPPVVPVTQPLTPPKGTSTKPAL